MLAFPFSRSTAIGDTRAQTLIIIPAYNEEESLHNVVADVHAANIGDILVIDDGSVDHTAQVAAAHGAHVVRLPYNLGIGAAVQTGLKYALKLDYEFVLRVDGDGQHSISEAKRLLEHVIDDHADITIGSRFIPGHQTYKPPMSRALGILWFSKLVSWLTGNSIYDPTSGMQAMNRRALTILARDYPQDYPEVEAHILLHKAGLRVVEVTAKMAPRQGGMSSITYLRAIYYAFKVTLATFLAALRRKPRQVR
jgi:glycosyltransferase involved in cell wall biosynthesis